MRKYAIITSTDWGYLYSTTALINGLARYGNNVDLHIVITDDVLPEYLTGLPDWVHLIPLSTLGLLKELNPSNVDNRGLPWQVRYARYYVAQSLCSSGYSTVSIVDSDCFVVGNIMTSFARACADQGHLVMVTNSMAWSGDPTQVTRATQPPYHCHWAFFDCGNHLTILKRVWELGLTNPYGDMVNLCRAVTDSNVKMEDVLPLPNHLWCINRFWGYNMTLILGGHQPVLLNNTTNEMVLSAHGKWFNPNYREKALENCKEIGQGRINTGIFAEIYKWFNENGPVYCKPKELV